MKLRKRKANQAATVAAWDLGDDPLWVEGPSSAASVARKPRWWERWVKTLVYVGLAGIPLAILLMMMSISLMSRVSKIPDSPTGAQLQSSPGVAVARASLDDWLAQTPSPLPGATVLAWTGSQVVNPVSVSGVKAAPVGFTSEIDTFSLKAGNTTYTAGIQVLIDPRGGAVAVGTPSLVANAVAANDTWKDGAPWPGLQAGGNIPSPVEKAVGNWASAYTSGDPGTLQNSVGDANTGHAYVPLPGVIEVQSYVTRGAFLGPVGSKSTMIVQVELTLRYAGQPALTSGAAAGRSKSVSTLDVLVERADGAAPIVTAWGPSGSGPTLQRYSNAVSAAGRTMPAAVVGPSASPSVTTTSTSTAKPTSTATSTTSVEVTP